ncbi:MAG TPA: hypothetical protein VLK65_10130 [Vicinamibacteria bacterium]|nr:hypothetical protein [Vicinamibacteria bacterium]
MLGKTLRPSTRPLTETERRFLRAKIRDLKSRAGRGPHVVGVGALAIGMLWALTLMASQAPWLLITLFWILVGGGILFWVRRDLGKDLAQFSNMGRALESALRRNEAEVFLIKAKSFVELEELEDEGACYAFDIDEGRIVFVVGQEFYPEAKFPSHDFSLVYLLDERGNSVHMVIEKRGRRASPARVMPGDFKRGVEIPEHLEVIRGSLSQIEEILGRRSP